MFLGTHEGRAASSSALPPPQVRRVHPTPGSGVSGGKLFSAGGWWETCWEKAMKWSSRCSSALQH